MGLASERDTSKADSLFIIDLKIYHESHEELKAANEVITMTRSGLGGLLFAEIVLRRKKIIKREILNDLRERLDALDLENNEV